MNNGAGQLFTKESDNGSDCENAPWIVAGFNYAFRVHTSNSDAAPVLASVGVTGVLGAPPNPPPADCGPGGNTCTPGTDCHCGDLCRPIDSICP
jgi:hypothetical protein